MLSSIHEFHTGARCTIPDKLAFPPHKQALRGNSLESCHASYINSGYEDTMSFQSAGVYVAIYMLYDGGAWSTGCIYTSGCFDSPRGRRPPWVCQNEATSVQPSKPQARHRVTYLYDESGDKALTM